MRTVLLETSRCTYDGSFQGNGIICPGIKHQFRDIRIAPVRTPIPYIPIGLVSGKFNSPNVDFLVYTKAVNEMRGFLRIFGCESDTIFRYCGIGDLGLTALNDLSRNRTLGMLIGKGFGFDPDSKSSTVVEGLRTVKLMGEITREKNVTGDFPLVQALYRLLYENDSLNDYTVSVLN